MIVQDRLNSTNLKMTMPKELAIQGFCDDAFLPLKESFEQNFEDGLELGASLALTHRGKLVVDLWGGHFNQGRRTPWQSDTIVNVASTTKIAAALCTLVAIDKGLLELDAPIATYWPEFAQGGKEKATVRHALFHSTGAPGLKIPANHGVQNNIIDAADIIAREPAWFEPGSVTCYHAVTYGVILGELIRRTDGRGPAQFFSEEIALPTESDFSIGVRSNVPFQRVTSVVQFEEDKIESGSIPDLVLRSFSADREQLCWDSMSRENMSGSGYGNARSIAKFTAILANKGSLNGKQFISPELLNEVTTEQYYGEDLAIGTIRYGLGFGLDSPEFKAPTPESFHWGGKGGSWASIDPVSETSAAYAMNLGVPPEVDNFGTDPRQVRLWKTLGEVLQNI